MAAQYSALCSEFFVNQRLTLRMDLPHEREALLSLFDRVRRQRPRLAHLRRFEAEVVLESDSDLSPYEWLSVRRTSIRSGVESPDSLADAYELHAMVLELAPYFMSISPLDVEALELMFGFDLEVESNRNEVVFEALFGDSPMAALVDLDREHVIDCQPYLAVALDERSETQAIVDLKTRVTQHELRSGRFHNSPITLYTRVRYTGGVGSIEELPQLTNVLAEHLERFAEERVIPRIIKPIREVILSRPS